MYRFLQLSRAHPITKHGQFQHRRNALQSNILFLQLARSCQWQSAHRGLVVPGQIVDIEQSNYTQWTETGDTHHLTAAEGRRRNLCVWVGEWSRSNSPGFRLPEGQRWVSNLIKMKRLYSGWEMQKLDNWMKWEIAAVAKGHPLQSLCPVCAGLQRREHNELIAP